MGGEAFFQQTPAMCLIGGFDGYFKHANPAFTRVLGWTEEELLGFHFLEIVHPDDVTVAEAAYSGLINGGHAHVSVRTRHKDGSYRWTKWTARTDAERGLIYSFGTDVRAESGEEATEGDDSDPSHRTLIDRPPVGIAVTATNGHILDVNESLCDLLGFSDDELTGRELSSVIGEEGRERHRAAQKEMLAGAVLAYDADERFLRADGRTAMLHLHVDIVRDASGSPLCFVSHISPAQGRSRPVRKVSEPAPTRRELEVLGLAAQGLSTDAMADRLEISPTTVKTHLQNLYAKLSVSNRAAAVAEALRRGLIRLD